MRTITLKFKTPCQHNKAGKVKLKADIAAIMRAPNKIDLSRQSSVTGAKNGGVIAVIMRKCFRR